LLIWRLALRTRSRRRKDETRQSTIFDLRDSATSIEQAVWPFVAAIRNEF
jgi:hypothetical protein